MLLFVAFLVTIFFVQEIIMQVNKKILRNRRHFKTPYFSKRP